MTLEFEDAPPLVHTDQTMTKVNEALESLGLNDEEIGKIVETLLDRGIFFRERSGTTLKKCGRDSCTATINADREGCATAWREGWYLQKWGGPVWCPIHIPEWVPSSFVRQKEQEA